MQRSTKVWQTTNSALNSTANSGSLVTPSQTDVSQINVTAPSVPVAKRPISTSAPIMKPSIGDGLSGIDSLNRSVSAESNIGVGSNINPIGTSIGVTGSTSGVEGATDPTSTNTNSALNSYGGMGGYGGGYGGYGMGGYGMGGMGYGGYGMGGYGMGGYGMGGYGMGGMGGYGMNGKDGPDFIDMCFMNLERLNFQIFHFCEMTRMLQSQSASLQYFWELCTAGYTKIKDFFVNNTRSFIDGTKLAIINKYISMKETLQEFFQREGSSNEKLKSQIKFIDRVLTVIIIATFFAMIFKR